MTADEGMDDDISIHALREEGDPVASTPSCVPSVFLSTPSARRATSRGVRPASKGSDFYPRPPRGGRRLTAEVCPLVKLFLSTPSARRATRRARRVP